jgi:hypothetical protein
VTDAQAIPDNLFCYSDQTKNANADLRNWIASVLAPAVRGYQETAIDFGGSIDDLTRGPGIDVQAQNILAQIAATDEQVRSVGQAFLDAGDRGLGSVSLPAWAGTPLDPGTGDHSRYAIITTSDSAVANDLSSQEGTQLAKYANEHHIDSNVLRQLTIHQDDQYYCAAFYNGLTPLSLQGLLTMADETARPLLSGADSQLIATTLANAYAASTLSAGVKQTVAQWMLTQSRMRFYPEFMTQLAHNPQAALSFTRSLTDTQFVQIVGGAGAIGNDQAPAMFISVCAAALNAMSDPGEAAKLMGKLYTAVHNLTPADMDSTVLPALVALIANFYHVYLTPPPSGFKDEQALSDWITKKTMFAAQCAWAFSKWIYSADTASDSSQTAQRDLMMSLILAAVLAPVPVLGEATDATVAARITAEMIRTAMVSWAVSGIDATVFLPPDAQDVELRFDHRQCTQMQLLVTAQLIEAGTLVYVRTDGVPESIATAAAAAGENPLQFAVGHSHDIHVAGLNSTLSYFSTLSYVLLALEGQYLHTQDQSSQSALIAKSGL